jgi:hypothetical protein
LGGGKDLEVNGVLGSEVLGSGFRGSGFRGSGFRGSEVQRFWVQRFRGSGFSAASGRERPVKSKKKLMNIEHRTSNIECRIMYSVYFIKD